MEELRKLNVELDTSASKLYTAARKRGLDITREQAKEATSSTRELFRKVPKSDGKVAARGKNSKLQIDLIDFKQEDTKKTEVSNMS